MRAQIRRVAFIAIVLPLLACGQSTRPSPGKVVPPALPIPATAQGTCDPGLVACPGSGTGYCFDLQASPEHCGTCGHACALGSPCENGQCRVISCTSAVSVESQRVDLTSDAYVPMQVALLDCNRDGTLDLIAPSPPPGANDNSPANEILQQVSVYRANGDGTFVRGERYPAHVPRNLDDGAFRMVVADLNRDQIPDIVMTARTDSSTPTEQQITVAARLGRGDCSFGPEIGLAAGIRPSSLAVADLDGDGILDLAVAAEEGQHLRTFHGNGDGSFSNRQEWPVGGLPLNVVVTDWNSDNIPDLVAADDYLHVLPGTGNGQFAPVLDCAVSLGVPGQRKAFLIADFDQDGVADLATNNTILLGMKECNFSRLVTFPVPGLYASPLLSGDFNGDGALDLVFASSKAIGLVPGDGQGGFAEVVTLGDFDQLEHRMGSEANAVAAAGDFNGDGRLDLMVANGISLRTFTNTCP